jgi:hypothetical protein
MRELLRWFAAAPVAKHIRRAGLVDDLHASIPKAGEMGNGIEYGEDDERCRKGAAARIRRDEINSSATPNIAGVAPEDQGWRAG